MWSHKLIWKCTCLLKTVWKSLISDNVVAGLAKIFEIHPSNYRQRCWHVLFFGTWLRCFQAHLSVNISGGLSSCKYNFCITLIQYTVSPIMRVFHTLKKKKKKNDEQRIVRKHHFFSQLIASVSHLKVYCGILQFLDEYLQSFTFATWNIKDNLFIL